MSSEHTSDASEPMTLTAENHSEGEHNVPLTKSSRPRTERTARLPLAEISTHPPKPQQVASQSTDKETFHLSESQEDGEGTIIGPCYEVSNLIWCLQSAHTLQEGERRQSVSFLLLVVVAKLLGT